jgi:hypothetical protein
VQIVYPEMDEFDWAMTEVKGWIGITIRWAEGETAVTFYDPVRLAQEVQSAVNRSGYFAEPAVIVVPAVTKEAIEAVAARIAEKGFREIV